MVNNVFLYHFSFYFFPPRYCLSVGGIFCGLRISGMNFERDSCRVSIASYVLGLFPVIMKGFRDELVCYTPLIMTVCARGHTDGRICFCVGGARLPCTWECISTCCVDSQMRRIDFILIYCLHLFFFLILPPFPPDLFIALTSPLPLTSMPSAFL